MSAAWTAKGPACLKSRSGMHEAAQGWERGRLVRIRSEGVFPISSTAAFARFALSADGTSAFPAIDRLVLTLVAAG